MELDLAPGRLGSQVGDFMGQLAAQLQPHEKPGNLLCASL
jgi:hypothetical protein